MATLNEIVRQQVDANVKTHRNIVLKQLNLMTVLLVILCLLVGGRIIMTMQRPICSAVIVKGVAHVVPASKNP